MRQPIQVAVYPVCFIEEHWKYLMLHRNPMPRLGLDNFWQGVTGGLEEGESLIQAAARELSEETALVPTKLEQIDFTYSIPMQDEWRKYYDPDVEEIVENVFIAYISHLQEPKLSFEHYEWRWCTSNQAIQLLKYPGNINAIQRCAEHLQNKA